MAVVTSPTTPGISRRSCSGRFTEYSSGGHSMSWWWTTAPRTGQPSCSPRPKMPGCATSSPMTPTFPTDLRSIRLCPGWLAAKGRRRKSTWRESRTGLRTTPPPTNACPSAVERLQRVDTPKPYARQSEAERRPQVVSSVLIMQRRHGREGDACHRMTTGVLHQRAPERRLTGRSPSQARPAAFSPPSRAIGCRAGGSGGGSSKIPRHRWCLHVALGRDRCSRRSRRGRTTGGTSRFVRC